MSGFYSPPNDREQARNDYMSCVYVEANAVFDAVYASEGRREADDAYTAYLQEALTEEKIRQHLAELGFR